MNWKKLLAALAAAWMLLLAVGCGDDAPVSGEGSVAVPDSSESAAEPSSGASSEAAPEESQSTPPQSEDPADPASAPPASDPGDWRLVLVNKEHPIDKELDITLEEVGGYKVDTRMAGPLRDMLAAAKKDGFSLTIISGYRTLERSRILYENKIKEYENLGYSNADARVQAARWVAPPGTSEHHTGLAADIVSAGYYNKYTDLVEAFEDEPEGRWLAANAPRFGFILRFPKDKEDITGINYEPWHFRYVGEEHAAAITEAGLCLEEYLAGKA